MTINYKKIMKDVDLSEGFGISQLRLQRLYLHLRHIGTNALINFRDMVEGEDVLKVEDGYLYTRFDAQAIADHWGVSVASLRTNYVKPLKNSGKIRVVCKGRKNKKIFFTAVDK